MHCFPQKLDAEINQFFILQLVNEVEHWRKGSLDELGEVMAFLFSDAELKGCCNGNQNVEEGSKVIVFLADASEDLVNWHPVFVLISDNERQDFFETSH